VRKTIEIKDSDGSYHEVGALTGQDPARVIDGPMHGARDPSRRPPWS
jgi:hypothetical protein